ncbi:SMI1/KNR4 family protein [Alkalihalobacillus berkeleyi]|uniref:SMI1/KNR4 family protein n=1 Tax=Pseudalkalibacillus berkeleyi TaxID=1069813 RepID=A0ABS9GYD5_9BACL|nr:SMI1/KNR4 family protein [Pseudalkalibacillus berkeleyi]
MKNIWQEDNDYCKLEPLTEEAVKRAEGQLKIKLPNLYINILKQQNGGSIKFNAFPTDVPTDWAEDHINIDHFFGIGLDKEKGILDSDYLIQEWDLPRNLVLISGAGHSWFALDYRYSKTDPSVIFIDVELHQELKLASNFEEFIQGLFINIEEEKSNVQNSVLSEQEINNYCVQIDDAIRTSTPKEIDSLFTKILSTNSELTRYMVEKMRHHKNSQVHFNLLLYLSCCAEGENKGILKDD